MATSNLSVSAQEIALQLGAEIVGDGSVRVSGLKPLDSAKESDLSFLTHTGDKSQQYLEMARASSASALLVPEADGGIKATQIIVPNPMAAIVRLAEVFYKAPRPAPGVSEKADVAADVSLGDNVAIGAFAVVGAGASIGDNTVIHANATIYPGVSIGKNCIIHSGAIIREFVQLGDDCLIQNGVVLGGDGFGYLPDKSLGHRRIPHIGNLILEDRVDVGANSTIDRATLGSTRIGKATKVDNLVMIGHNVQIGERGIFCGQVGISGSTKIGNDVLLAGQAGVADHAEIGDNVRLAGNSGLAGKVEGNQDYSGIILATPALKWRRSASLFLRLPELFKRIRKLEKNLEAGD